MSKNVLKHLNLPLVFSKRFLQTQASLQTAAGRLNTHVQIAHTRKSTRTWSASPSKLNRAGWQTWKTGIVLPLEHMANTDLVQHQLHLAWSLPSGFICETRSRENELRFENTSSNIEQNKTNSFSFTLPPRTHTSSAALPPQEPSEDQAGFQLRR